MKKKNNTISINKNKTALREKVKKSPVRNPKNKMYHRKGAIFLAIDSLKKIKNILPQKRIPVKFQITT